ncbi:hypothetical protein BV25DRAFT_1830235 [Artomyces pyxidatus]|uniref:Uncharacterized protein n=1 Tax=Artomyces pyxidatus TaxID=48021 RepID=A0ACB8SPR1_9AGAM|nr:hypothetical protein BV25DRAFT_1830235 [Artomyces pyxidatus]
MSEQGVQPPHPQSAKLALDRRCLMPHPVTHPIVPAPTVLALLRRCILPLRVAHLSEEARVSALRVP